jgi:acetyl esterase/lipase
MEKRTLDVLRRYLQPTNLDVEEFARLWAKHALGPLRGRCDGGPMTRVSPFLSPGELTEREIDDIDDFAASAIASKADIRAVFAEQFFYGAEADDKLTSLAFRPDLNISLRPMFSSDIGHFDVLDMSEVLSEAWKQVELGLLDEEQFRQFTFSNTVELHTRLNPGFFDGTAVAGAARRQQSAVVG